MQQFNMFSSGKTCLEAYQNAMEEAGFEEEAFRDNRLLATTIGVTETTDAYRESGKKMREFLAERLEKMGAGQCEGIEIEPAIFRLYGRSGG